MPIPDQVLFWHWWILAAVVLVLELGYPAFLFLWIGIAAVAVGFVMLIFPGVALAAQLGVFGSLSLIALAVWRR